MTDPIVQVGRQLSWLLIVRGIFAVLFGVVAIVWPGITAFALVIIFGAYAIVDGVTALMRAWQSRGQSDDWWWWAAMGAVSVLAGVIAFVWPDITALSLLYLLAFYAIFFGGMGVFVALGQRKVPGTSWGWHLAASALAIVFGIVLLIAPVEGILSIVWVVGWYAILFGVLLAVAGVQLLRRAH